jgi:hypothetical protein
MAKQYYEPHSDIKNIFDKAIQLTGLNHKIGIGVLSDNDLKVIAEVKKGNPIYQYRTKIDVDIVINESIFEGIPAELQPMVAEEILCPISVNPESGSVIISKPDFTTFKGFIKKYSVEQVELMREVVQSLFDKKEEEERKRKDATNKIKMNKK